ncbi:MAG TPA: 30S ribosome-binding factor RbfA [Tissierellaceae bacterium]
MNDKRINRISEEVRRAMTEILYNGLKDPRVDSSVTVTKVQVTKDLSFANIFVSVLGDEKKKEDVIEGLNNAKGFIRTEIGRKVDLRHVPKPMFRLDESTEYAMHINELIDQVKSDKNE